MVDFVEVMAWVSKNWYYLAIPWAVIVVILVILWWRRRGKDYGPTTVLVEFDSPGICEPNYVAREDQGPSFVSFYRADGSIEYRKKPRVGIYIPDKKGKSYDILYFNPRQSDSCVEIDELFQDFEPREQIVEEIVSEHANQFQIIRKQAHRADWVGSKGKIILIAVVILGFALGIVADAGYIHAGAR